MYYNDNKNVKLPSYAQTQLPVYYYNLFSNNISRHTNLYFTFEVLWFLFILFYLQRSISILNSEQSEEYFGFKCYVYSTIEIPFSVTILNVTLHLK